MSSGNGSSSSKTAIDTVVNGVNSVTINNDGGNLTLNGAQITNKNADGTVSDGTVDIHTGNLTITTPQNTSKYDSTTVKGGIDASMPIVGSDYTNIKPNIGYVGMHNDYKSTEQTMSGVYAGKGGLNVDVTGKTTLTAGSITSAADASKNQFTTGELVANSLDNKDKWSGLNASASMSFDLDYNLTGKAPSTSHQTTLVAGSILSSAGIPIFSSSSVSHDKTSTTNSVIGDNITINAGSTSGFVSRNPDAANGYIASTFDATQINSDLNKQNTISGLMGQATNIAIEATGEKDNFKGGSWNKIGLDMAIGAGTAAFGGGNIGATVAGAAAGDAMNVIAHDVAQSIADSLFPPNQKDVQQHKEDVHDQHDLQIKATDKYPFDAKNKDSYVKKEIKPVQDTTSDPNKITSSLIQGLLTGGAGAVAGAITSDGNNLGVDVLNSSTSAMSQSRPEVKDPVAVLENQRQEIGVNQAQTRHAHDAITVITQQDNYHNEGAFMNALYHALNPSDPSSPTITPDQAHQINTLILNKGNYNSDIDFANALNKVFIETKKK